MEGAHYGDPERERHSGPQEAEGRDQGAVDVHQIEAPLGDDPIQLAAEIPSDGEVGEGAVVVDRQTQPDAPDVGFVRDVARDARSDDDRHMPGATELPSEVPDMFWNPAGVGVEVFGDQGYAHQYSLIRYPPSSCVRAHSRIVPAGMSLRSLRTSGRRIGAPLEPRPRPVIT